MIKRLVFCFMSATACQSFAANPYVDCGIGAALFPNTHWAAVTSNVIWDAGTTALISATASEDTCSGNSFAAAQLIHDKYALLETDIILGSGGNIAALSSLLECKDSSTLPASVSDDLSHILDMPSYSGSTRVEKAIQLYEALRSNKEVQLNCSKLS